MAISTEEQRTVTARVPAEKVDALDQLAKQQDRDRSYLINEAIDQYLAHRQWMVDEIRRATAEADAGDFVPDDEMEKIMAKWTK
jgi:RHH-type transcriptional regulator, rel operon repressor / antitoxin RelB